MRSDRWIVLVVLLLVRTAMGFQFQTVGAIGTVLVDAFAIDYARLGTLIGLYLLPGIVIALPSGMLGDRFGVKTVALAGLALMAAGGLLSAVAPSFGVLVLARLVSGTGAVLVNVAVTAMTSDWFLGRELRTAMAVVVASWPLGLALGLVVFPPLALGLGWQAVMLGGAGACLLMLALLGAAYRDPPGLPARHAAALPLNLTGREWQLVLTAGLIWGVYNVAYILLISFVPNLFVAQGHTPLAATGLASLLGWALIGMVPVGGVLADRSRRADLVMVASFAVTAVAVVLLIMPPLTWPAYAVMLVFGGLPAGAIMALPASVLGPESRAAGMGVYYTCYYALMAALPPLAGLSRDLSGSDAAPVLFSTAMLAVAIAGVAVFRRLAGLRPAP